MPVNATPGNGLVYLSWSGYYDWDFGFYRITTWQVPNTSVSQRSIYNINQTTTTINGLTNGVSYYFTVETLNSGSLVIQYDKSNTVTPTLPFTVPSAPTIGTATAGNATANLNWTEPNNGGSQITHYIVNTYNSSNDNFVQDTSSTILSVSVSSLNNGTSYYFKVLAVNAVGNSNESIQSSSITPYTVPNQIGTIDVVLSNDRVDLSWNEPFNGGNYIFEYKIDIYFALSNTYISTTTSANTNFTLGPGLGSLNNQQLRTNISARNYSGYSIGTDVYFTTYTIPSQITSIIAISGYTSIDLSWNAPFYNIISK